MSSCLGLYIESNLIKYAKVTKDRDNLKVESFGIKFYDKIGEAINQIISETFSFKTPISINLSEEVYQYFYFFNLLNKNDLKKAIETEFESYCSDKNFNRNALETRYALVEDLQDKEKIKAIYISVNKAEINRKLQEFDGNAVSTITSLPIAITNVIDANQKENVAIINIEENTTITTVLEQKIYNVDRVDVGMETILNSISEKENSYSKAYEICKNTTIYTMEGKELIQEEENQYLEDIMPTLYNIVQEVKNIVDNSLNRIDKIYITGTGSVINNIDLYFQEYFTNIKCEILKPFFIPENVKINIKDYIEVNSAIALAMQGLGYGVKSINFKRTSIVETLSELLKIEVQPKDKKKENKEKQSNKNKKINFSFDLKGKLDNTEKWLIRTASGVLAFIIIYGISMTFLQVNTNNKIKQINTVKEDTQEQIQLADRDLQKLNNKTTNYQRMTENLKSYSDAVAEKNRTKNVIPTLLSELMYIIPQGVTITSIENTTGSHIVINAQSNKYELLGYLKGKIITDGILSPSTVISTSGVKQNDTVMVVIEGDLPWEKY
mgnify:FL=1